MRLTKTIETCEINTTEGGGDLESLWLASSDLSGLIFCRCFAVIACGIGLFHMARASSRLTSVQINAKKTTLGVSSCSALTAPPGAHICLNCAYLFTLKEYFSPVSQPGQLCARSKPVIVGPTIDGPRCPCTACSHASSAAQLVSASGGLL